MDTSSRIDAEDHLTLYLPGPTEVRREILDAQCEWMIGHRMPECAELIERVEPALKSVFMTGSRVLISASSGTGLWEGASRNCVRQRILHCVNGAFSERWAEVSALNGKEVDVLEVPWGEAIRPEMVAQRLAGGGFDAIALAHNETSTGVAYPLWEIAAEVRSAPGGDDIMILVDAVSSWSGVELRFDEWDLDVALTSSQKAFALPPGLSFCAVSDRAMDRARSVPNRGYYFDFITLDESLSKNQTPATPAISLLFAADLQLQTILSEGLEARWERHLAMRDATLTWAERNGIPCFAESGYRSPTVSCLDNARGIDIGALNAYLRTKGMILSNGYGALKGKTFRIGHMGEHDVASIRRLTDAIDEHLVRLGDGAVEGVR